ncbi:MAG: hypothetical protein ACLFNI_08650 [Natronomonas sp.]
MSQTTDQLASSEVAVGLVHVVLVTVIVVTIGSGLFDDSLARSTTIGVAVGVGYAIAHRLVGRG